MLILGSLEKEENSSRVNEMSGNRPFRKKTWEEDDQRNVQLYTSLAEKFGPGVRALNWSSEKSQQLRFEILNQVGRLHMASVLDVGCGLGDFLDWVQAAGIKINYTGLDLTPRMIEIARTRFPGKAFILGSLFDAREQLEGSYDFVLASGIFYLRKNSPWKFLTRTVALMFRLCKQAVAFNSLSAWAPKKEGQEYYPDPLLTAAYCHTLTPWVVLRHDYHPGDFTIYMYKQGGLSP
jgi:SAM-dependent methyltransferase